MTIEHEGWGFWQDGQGRWLGAVLNLDGSTDPLTTLYLEDLDLDIEDMIRLTATLQVRLDAWLTGDALIIEEGLEDDGFTTG